MSESTPDSRHAASLPAASTDRPPAGGAGPSDAGAGNAEGQGLSGAWFPAKWRRRPRALVVGAFPPQGGRGPLVATLAAHALATLGHEVTTLCVTGAGDAHLVLDFRKGREIAHAASTLRGEAWETVVVDPAAFRFRRPDTLRRLGVIPRQIAFLAALLHSGRRRVIFSGRPGGWPLLAALAGRALAAAAHARPDPAAALPEVRDVLLAALAPRGAAAPAAVPPAPAAAPAPAPVRAVAAAMAPDPAWSVPGEPVPRLAVHLGALRRGPAGRVPGTAAAARALRAWFAAQGVAVAGVPAARAEEAAIAASLGRWWSQLAGAGGLRAPIVAGRSDERGGEARPLSAALAAPVRPAPRIHLVGHTDAQTGLGANLRMTREALVRTGCRPSRSVTGRHSAISLELPVDGPPGRRLARSLRIFHLNADALPEALLCPSLVPAPGALEIGFLLWEFAALPEAHRLALEMLDEIWCPTGFVADAYRAAGQLPVHVVGKAVTVPEPARLSRAALGLPEDAFVFLQAFDFHSSVERKNPLALLRAFRAAFPDGLAPSGREVALVFKTTEVLRGHWGDPHGQWSAIEEAARRDGRIRILSGRIPPERYAALLAAADCVVSPHRAEGFGYVPAQALLLGRPVVTTDHSGTRDFCTERTAFPVPCRLREVRAGETIHPLPGGLWAEIDGEALARTLLQVVEDPGEAARRARAGQDLMLADYSLPAQAGRLTARLEALGVLDRASEAA